jgi:hypothetical protein
MSQELLKYTAQIEDIAAHAKSIGFDPVNGNYDELYESWYKQNYRFYASLKDNKEQVVDRLRTIN